jgi:acetyl esterase
MLHPETRALLDLMIERQVPPVNTLAPPEARRLYLERRNYTQPDAPEVASVRDLAAPTPAGDVPLRSYRPLGAAAEAVLPALVYFHGGGWTIGDLDTHDVLCRQLANGSGIAVVSVGYRLGPEHRFPAAVDDALAATRWVCTQAAALGLDPLRIAVGGDSAGGNLAAVVAIIERDAGRALAYQLLIYPATDQRQGQPSHSANGEGYLLTRDSIRWFHQQYLGGPAHDSDWRASPLLAADLSRLPPALVLTAGYDPLRDEGLQYAQRLTAAGTPCTYVCFERQIHGFVLMGRVLAEARSAVALCAAELRRALHPAGCPARIRFGQHTPRSRQ